MQLRLLALPALLAAPLVASLFLQRRPEPPEVVAEPLPALAPATAAPSEPAPAQVPRVEEPPKPPTAGAQPILANRVKGPGAETRSPAPHRPRTCPQGISRGSDDEDYLRRHGHCPPLHDTPLVLSFDGGPVEYLADREHAFDVDGDASEVTDWPTARTPWLALDRDGDGRIADGSELFGSMTVLAGGERAPDGFAALRELDADGDGRITPDDPGFARLLVWADRDGDRRSAPGELVPASAWGLTSIDLDYAVDPRCDARGNCEVERATFHFRDAAGVQRTGAVIDVHLAVQR